MYKEKTPCISNNIGSFKNYRVAMLPIRLEIGRFPGGFAADIETPGIWRAKILPIERLSREAVSLEAPLFVAFLNCRSDVEMRRFLMMYWNHPQVEVEALASQQRTLRSLATQTISKQSERGPENANLIDGYLSGASLHNTFRVSMRPIDGVGRLALSTASTWEYMLFELAMAFEVGAVLGTCQRCTRHFLYGTATGRRSTAKYCSMSCNSATKRARKAEREQ